MIKFLAPILLSALFMRIKGGGPNVAPLWFRARDGGIDSAFMVVILAGFYINWWMALLFGLAYWAVNTMSMSEEVSAAGGYKGNWPDGRDSWFGSKALTWIKNDRVWGWASGGLRGAFIGACLALCSWNPWFILAGASFPLCYYIGVSIRQFQTGQIEPKDDAWAWGEWIWGGALGMPFLLQ